MHNNNILNINLVVVVWLLTVTTNTVKILSEQKVK